jgi:hypothetical protein
LQILQVPLAAMACDRFAGARFELPYPKGLQLFGITLFLLRDLVRKVRDFS